MEIKENRIMDYEEMHLNAWPELLKTCKQLGMKDEQAFIYKNLAIIVLDCDDLDKFLLEFGGSEVGKKWMDIINPMVVYSSTALKKIYDMNEWLEKIL